jgi:hypothetical protein
MARAVHRSLAGQMYTSRVAVTLMTRSWRQIQLDEPLISLISRLEAGQEAKVRAVVRVMLYRKIKI